jgi:vancomycin resistance protein VanJ
LARLLAAYPIAWVAFALVALIVEPRDGLPALLVIVSPHLFLLGLLLLPVAAVLRDRILLVAMAVFVVVGVVRFADDWVSLPADAVGGSALHVVTWNLEAGAAPASDVVNALLAQEADLVALQELRPDVAAALDNDPTVAARFPFRLLYPDREVFGIGLLSRYPLEELARYDWPVGLSARVDLGADGEAFVLNSHPMPGELGRLGFDATRRDEELAAIRPRIDALLARSARVLVMGDYNTTPEEPGYSGLAAGLGDAHRSVGIGPGWTWRPGRLKPWQMGFVRIDYVFTGPGLSPVSSSEDCSYAGDHCLLRAAIGLSARDGTQ